MKDWQPIDTAPKDGTWVMIHYHPRCVPLITFYDEFGKRWIRDQEFGNNKPTHWMSIPDAPVIEN